MVYVVLMSLLGLVVKILLYVLRIVDMEDDLAVLQLLLKMIVRLVAVSGILVVIRVVDHHLQYHVEMVSYQV